MEILVWLLIGSAIVISLVAAGVIFGGVLAALNRYWWAAALLICAGLAALLGPWAVSNYRISTAQAQISEASFWPEDLSFDGQTLLFIADPVLWNSCHELCELIGGVAERRQHNGRVRLDTDPDVYVLQAEDPLALMEDLIGSGGSQSGIEDITVRHVFHDAERPLADIFSQISYIVVQNRAHFEGEVMQGPLAIPEWFDNRPTWVIQVFEQGDLWEGNAPIARLLAVSMTARGIPFPLRSNTRLRPEGCETYRAVLAQWIGRETRLDRAGSIDGCRRVFQ